MGPLYSSVVEAVSGALNRVPEGSDEKLRRQHYGLLLLLALPAMGGFGLVLGLKGELLLLALVLTSAAGLSTGWILLGRGASPLLVYRTNAAAFSVLIVYMAAVGGEDGSKVLWTYTFPLIAFFLLGKREGAVWVSLVLAAASLFVLGVIPGAHLHEYTPGLRVRYIVTMLIVTAIAAGFEHFREIYHRGMETKRIELEAALEQVTALSGLLPICSHCKKIRDDQGYWNRIETYIHAHSEARFSHGICPDCAQEHYGELAKATATPPPASEHHLKRGS